MLQRRTWTRPADHVETPGLCHIPPRVHTARPPWRRPAQSRGTWLCLAKGKGFAHRHGWFTARRGAPNTADASVPTQQTNDHPSAPQTSAYRLGSSVKWNPSSSKRKHATWKAGDKLLPLASRTMQVIILSWVNNIKRELNHSLKEPRSELILHKRMTQTW